MTDQPTIFDMPDSIASKAQKLNANALKAVQWYMREHNLKAELSNPPLQMHFNHLVTGERYTLMLDDIIDEYKAWKKEDQKQRAKERAAAKKLATQGGRILHEKNCTDSIFNVCICQVCYMEMVLD